MVGTKFLVQWEEHPSHMATRLGYLLENQILVDVTLMCNTHTLKVHKVVLASCSPYFEGVLQKQLGTHPLIVLKDMKFSVLRSLIEFMYCGETSIAEDNLPALLDAAKFFEVKGLASMNRDAMSGPNNSTTTSSTSGNTAGATKPSLLSGNSASKPSSLVTNGNVGLNSSSAVSTLTNEHGTSSSAVGGTNIAGNLAISSNFPRARGKITGRGRRSSFINSDPATTILSGANDPASILLSLSGSKPTTSHSPGSGAGTGLLTTKLKMSPGSTGVGGRFAGAATANSTSIISNGSLGAGEGLGLAHSEPRRRGRRKLGTTAADPMFDSRPGQDPSKSSSLSHSIKKSPLLASLLVTEHAKKKGTTTLVTDPRYAEMLKKAESGNGGNSLTLDPLSSTTDPNTIFYETNGSGDLVLSGGPSSASFQTNGTDLVSMGGSGQATFSNGTEGLVLGGGPNQATFLTVLGGEEGGEVTEAVVMQDGTICTAEGNQIAVDSKFVQSPHDPSHSHSSSLPLLSPHSSDHPTHHHTISLDSSLVNLDSLKHQVSPPPDPEAVVLYEMNEESNSLEKYVISSEEVQALRMLNTLVKEKGMSKRDISHMVMSNDETSNTQIAEIDLVLGGGRGKCKSLIKKILEMGNGLKGTLEKMVATRIPNNNNNELCSSGDSTTDKLVTEEMRDGSNSNCSTSIQDTGGDSTGFLLTGNDTTSSSQQGNGSGEITTHPSSHHHEFLIQTNTSSSHHSNDSHSVLTIENGDGTGGDVLMENGTEEEGGGGGSKEEEEEEAAAAERERLKVQNEEMSVEMEFKAMMEDEYEVTSVDTDKVNDEFKLHNEEEEEDSHSSHSYTSSQKIILSNVLMNSGEDMNILALVDPLVGHGGLRNRELLDDDCSQEEYNKSNSYVDEFISGAGNKRKSTDEENVVPAVKKHKYDKFNLHLPHSDGYNHGESQVGDDGLNDCNSQET
uniref:Longitudinals lacking protein, isoform G n=1 Tax=Cacopsylla melanoneura TaxID=428564 RepID=A0A8D9ADZ1_9HEMI